MLILWIRKRKEDVQTRPRQDETESFQKHDAEMKKFRLAHPEIEEIRSKDIITTDGNVLAPVHKVKLTKHVEN